MGSFSVGGADHRRGAQGGHEQAQARGEGLAGFGRGGGGAGIKEATDKRTDLTDSGGEIAAKEVHAEFGGEELVPLAGFTPGLEGAFAAEIKSRRAGRDVVAGFLVSDGGFAEKVEAGFESFGMEAASPLEALGRLEVVPLEAPAGAVKAAAQRVPGARQGGPELAF